MANRNTRWRNPRKPGSEQYTPIVRPKLPSQIGTVRKRGAGVAASRARSAEKAKRHAFGHTLEVPKSGVLEKPLAFYMTDRERSAYLNAKIRVSAQDQGT